MIFKGKKNWVSEGFKVSEGIDRIMVCLDTLRHPLIPLKPKHSTIRQFDNLTMLLHLFFILRNFQGILS